MNDQPLYEGVAARLDAAYGGALCPPVRDAIGLSADAGYAVQAVNTARWLAAGRRITGRKIGLTSEVVQKQLGVSEPDFGVLFADMEASENAPIAFEGLQQPRVEAEVALVVGRDLVDARLQIDDVISATAFAVASIEVVGSRIAAWDIRLSDTIADNASSSRYVLGARRLPLDGLDLPALTMTLRRNGELVSEGSGAACLGDPLNAALWLAREMIARGVPLRAGEVILTGALGPMVPAAAGDVFEAEIEKLGSVKAAFGGVGN